MSRVHLVTQNIPKFYEKNINFLYLKIFIVSKQWPKPYPSPDQVMNVWDNIINGRVQCVSFINVLHLEINSFKNFQKKKYW